MKKYEVLYRRIKNEIASGVLPEGGRLLSIRQEAVLSGFSVNTVINAYEILMEEGLVTSRGRKGFFVQSGTLEWNNGGIGEDVFPSNLHVAPSRETGERLDQLYERSMRFDSSFACASPGPDILPFEELGRAAAKIGSSCMEYGDPEGDYAFRKKIAILNRDVDGPCGPEDILITNGATEALNLVLRTLLRPGDTVALESPTYMNFFRQLAPMGVRIIEIPMGADGVDLYILEDELNRQKIRMIILQPNVQNPTGVTMGDSSKERLVALAEKYGTCLVQDDVYGDLSFDPFRPRNLSFFSDYPGIILVSSYSKSISPGLRIGWVRSRRYAKLLTEEKLRCSMDSSRAAQAIISTFLGTGKQRHHLRNIRKALLSRIDDHIRQLAEFLPEGSSVRRPSGGCLLWITFPEDIDATRLFEDSAGKGLIAAPGALFSSSRFYNNCIRLNAGRKLTKERSEALGILGEAVALQRGRERSFA